ncbi:MAG: YeeE/YedE thiosulfate transporter family protein [Rubrivivax sp.]|nr:YeeE/YedE thiosulfate transporter family protein [Rubrivivax sp.]
MSKSLSRHAPMAQAGTAVQPKPLPYWNPYLAGLALGLVLLVTFMVTGRGLGASSAFAAAAAWLASLGSVAHVEANPIHARYWNGAAPLLSWTVFLLLGAALGAFLSGWQGRRLSFSVERGPKVSDGTRLLLAFVGGLIVALGAKIAKGCTSGQALSGGSMLNVGSLVFMVSVFASAYALAYLVRKQWL